MSKKLFLLDTSAILAFMEDEEGSEEVERILRTEELLFPFVVLLEVYYISRRKRGQDIAEQRYATLRAINATRLDAIPEPVLMKAGEFKAVFRLSLADALIGAYAFVNGATLVHKNPEYEALEMVEQFRLPYKQRH